MYRVVSLSRQCCDYILLHLEEISISQLCLLPLSVRKELLWQLPIADICHLEDYTAFIEGLDMAAFWRYPWDEQLVGVFGWGPDKDIEHYVKEWDTTEYARAMLYGLVATSTIGTSPFDDPELFYFRSPHAKDLKLSVITLLFAVRRLDMLGNCKLEFPPRYAHAHHSGAHNKNLTMHEVLRYFGRGKDELPTILPHVMIDDSIKMDHVHFLHNIVYIGIEGRPFERKGLEFLKAVINEATHLEVLVLGGCLEEEEDSECLDDFCTYLSSHPVFLSNFRILKILNSEWRVSRHCFNQLITSYFAAPTDHMQKMDFSSINIKCFDVAYDFGPKIDQRYLSFKSIEFDCCKFTCEYEATPMAISHWLGQGIHEMKSIREHGACFFKVERKTCSTSRKRKHAELDSETDS